MTFSHDESHGDEPTPAWQARALDRSLGPARARSVERLAQFVQAARDLAAETGSTAFTVQQVVARSGQSLKSFYRYFAGKDELLLALIEEDCAVGALFLAEMVNRHRRPLWRVRAWVTGIFELMAAGERAYVTVLVREHRRLSEARPEAMAGALEPLLAILVDDLQLAMEAGDIRAGDPRRDARTIFDLVLANIHWLVLAPDTTGRAVEPDAREVAEYVWSFCAAGVQASPPSVGRWSDR